MARAPIQTARIGPVRYQLIGEADRLQNNQEYGEINSIAQHIKYDTGQAAARTIVHELIHGIRSLLTYTDDSDQEEEKHTKLIEGALVSFVADNPALCRWIIDRIDEEVNGQNRQCACSCGEAACGKPRGPSSDPGLPVNT